MSNYLGFEPTTASKFFFVSYNNEDADRVANILKYIDKSTTNLWYDYGIEYGEDWEAKIADMIDKSQAVILFLTRDVIEKSDSYVRMEYKWASTYFKKKIFVAILDDIQIHEIPAKIVPWYDKVIANQCICCKNEKEFAGEIARAILTFYANQNPVQGYGDLSNKETYNLKKLEKYANKNYILRTKTKERYIVENGCCVIGRGDDADFVIADNLDISRNHATVYYENGNWFVRDNSSVNGTYVGGVPISNSKPSALVDDNEFELANEKFVFYKCTKDIENNSIDIPTINQDNYDTINQDNYDTMILSSASEPTDSLDDYATEILNVCQNNNEVDKKTDYDAGDIVAEKYEILTLLGKGGSSTVYCALDKSLNKLVALKVISGFDVNDDSLVNSISSEYSLIMKLNHPAVPKVYEVIKNEEIILVQEYIEGETLSACLDQGYYSAYGSDEKTLLDILKQICDAMIYLHNSNIIYRDLKPSNVMIQPEGTIKLVDFGIARIYDDSKDYDTVALGTVGYAAPEQYGAGQSDKRTDVYAFGMLLYKIYTNKNPAHIEEFDYHTYDVPKDIVKIIEKCTQPNPSDRYQSFNEVLAALLKYEEKFDNKGSKKSWFKSFGKHWN